MSTLRKEVENHNAKIFCARLMTWSVCVCVSVCGCENMRLCVSACVGGCACRVHVYNRLVCEVFVGRRVHTPLALITLHFSPQLYLPP